MRTRVATSGLSLCNRTAERGADVTGPARWHSEKKRRVHLSVTE